MEDKKKMPFCNFFKPQLERGPSSTGYVVERERLHAFFITVLQSNLKSLSLVERSKNFK